jgi:hypothetical protein
MHIAFHIRHFIFKIVLLLLISFSISSCATFDPPVVVPVYGHIDSIHFVVPFDSMAKQGSPSAKITYAWVYLDNNPVGAFQLPCTFPMITGNGVHSIEVYPGITPVDGTSAASIYPFYQYYSVTLNLQQGSTYKIKPTSTYYKWSQFPLMENFSEAPGGQPIHVINYHGGGNASAGSQTTMLVTDNPNITFDRHGGSGMAIVNQSHNYYIGITNPPVALPTLTTPVYVELNYRATTSFAIGLFEDDTATQIQPVIIYPTATWNKIYVTLNSTISEYSIQPYHIYFAMARDSTDGHTADTLLLANIKILD